MVAEIRERFVHASAVILADYRGLNVKEMQQLRAALRDAGGDLKVYKNSLTEIAVRELALAPMNEYLEGPTALVFAADDPISPAKAMMAFAKEHTALEVKGGLFEDSLLDAAGVKAFAALPSREELVAKLLGTMLNPAAGLVRTLNGPAEAFARVMNSIAGQKAQAA